MSLHVFPSWNREFHLVTGRMKERGPGEDAARHFHVTAVFGVGPSLLSFMVSRQLSPIAALP